MTAERSSLLGGLGPQTNDAVPELTTLSVADGAEIEPLLRRAAADVSSLTLRLGAVTHRATAAEAQADAAGSPDGSTPEDDLAALNGQLQLEQAEQRRRHELELVEARAAATSVINAARADADQLVRAASAELDAAVASLDGARPVPQGEAPVEGEADVEVELPVATTEPAGEVEPKVGRADLSIVERLLNPEALMLVEIVFVVLLLLWLR